MNRRDAEGAEFLFTKRCYLAPLSAVHHNHVFELYRDHNVQQYLGGVLGDRNAFNQRYNEILQDKGAINWAVILKDCDDFMGMITIDLHHDKQDYEVGFKFFPRFWGQEYALETVTESISDAQVRLNLESIVAETQKNNFRCRRLLAKLGFGEERALMRHGEKQIFYRKIFAD